MAREEGHSYITRSHKARGSTRSTSLRGCDPHTAPQSAPGNQGQSHSLGTRAQGTSLQWQSHSLGTKAQGSALPSTLFWQPEAQSNWGKKRNKVPKENILCSGAVPAQNHTGEALGTFGLQKCLQGPATHGQGTSPSPPSSARAEQPACTQHSSGGFVSSDCNTKILLPTAAPCQGWLGAPSEHPQPPLPFLPEIITSQLPPKGIPAPCF